MAVCPTCEKTFAEDVTACPEDGSTLIPNELFAAMDHDVAAGTLVGEYKIQRKIGTGGFGAVYEAVHPLIGKSAAVKILNRQFSSSPQMVSRFIAEARAVNQIHHKNIVDVFSFGALPDGRQYYVMELLRGVTLHELVKRTSRLSPKDAIPILRGVARALDAAHKAGIIHRDLKPENVFLLTDEDGSVTPKLLDFGIAKLTGDLASASSPSKTKTGTAMGTPYYMSPEQARGIAIDHRSDVYSFGALVYEVLTGDVPFRGESPMDILLKHLSAPVPLLGDFDPALSGANIPLLRMMAKEPHQRYSTLVEAVESLAVSLDIAPASNLLPEIAALISQPQITPISVKISGSGESTAVQGLAQTAVSEDARARPAPRLETSLSAETDVASLEKTRAPRSRVLLLLVAAFALLSGAGVTAFVVSRQEAFNLPTQNEADPSARTSASASASSAEPSVDLASSALAITSSAPAPSAVASGAPDVVDASTFLSSQSVQHASISIRIETTPPSAQVYDGEELLGTAPGPFTVEKGKATALTVRMSGYAPERVTVNGDADETKSLALKKIADKNGSKISKDLESPF